MCIQCNLNIKNAHFLNVNIFDSWVYVEINLAQKILLLGYSHFNKSVKTLVISDIVSLIHIDLYEYIINTYYSP